MPTCSYSYIFVINLEKRYDTLPTSVKPGNQILMADGTVVLEVKECNATEGYVMCKATACHLPQPRAANKLQKLAELVK